MSGADSAGRPWAGRAFDAGGSAWSGDDGSAPAAYTRALAAFRTGDAPVEHVVAALRGVRLLVPLLAEPAETAPAGGRPVDGPTAHGRHDPSRRTAPGGRGHGAELALVTVRGPDGRAVLPAFSSAEAMRAWNPAARPVPAPARQVALGAAGDGTELVIVDAASPGRFGLRRGALEALARDLPWTAPFHDTEVARAIRRAVADEPDVTDARTAAGDPAATLDGAELRVAVLLHEGVDRSAVKRLLARLQRRWAEDPVVRARVDSMAVRIEAAAC